MHSPIRTNYVICLRDEAHKGSLERGKVYRRLPDPSAARSGYLRVIDESGEDYLYPGACFAPIKLPAAARRSLAAVPR